MEARKTQPFHRAAVQSDEGPEAFWNPQQVLSLLQWQQLCQQLGICDRTAIEEEFRRIVATYAESHRVFRTRREEILTRFLARSSIYRTDLFRDRLESQARDNLLAVISALKFSSP